MAAQSYQAGRVRYITRPLRGEKIPAAASLFRIVADEGGQWRRAGVKDMLMLRIVVLRFASFYAL
jgi:hypothetical protein